MTQENLRKFANIKVFGIGGGGGNAVNRMVAANVQGVEFWSINTDIQALNVSLADHKVQIGAKLTKGLGGGAIPSIGEQSAKESKEDIESALEGADMVFITAGMGGGTGTGASPIVARLAKDAGALTIAVVTKPFRFEGPVRNRQGSEGIDRLAEHVDAMIIIPNDNLLDVVEKVTSMVDAFKTADEILRQGVQGIADLITIPGLINLDFADVKTIMKDSGSAMMGIGRASGENRATEAAQQAVSSALLEETIDGATGVILNITGGSDLSLHEVHQAADVIYSSVDPNANILFGSVINEQLENEIVVTVIATGFTKKPSLDFVDTPAEESKPVHAVNMTEATTSFRAPGPSVSPETPPVYEDASPASPSSNLVTSFGDISRPTTQPAPETRDVSAYDPVTPESRLGTPSNSVQAPNPTPAPAQQAPEPDEFNFDIPAFLRKKN